MAEGARPTVLVVDDDEVKRYTIARVLTRAGFDVVEATTGEEGLRLARSRPDVIVLDVKLPDVDGFEVCRRLKSDPATVTIPVLHMSSTFVATADRVLGLDSGADAYLTSSAEPREWVATINALLRIRRAEETLRQANRRLELLSEISAELLLNDDPARFIDGIYRRLASHLGVTVFFHFLAGPDGRSLTLAAFGGVDAAAMAGLEELEPGRSVCGQVAAERRARYVENVQASADPLARLIRNLGLASYACHPLVANGRLVGTLSFGSFERASFSPDELALMRTVSDQVATAIERRRLQGELRQRNEQLAEESRRKDEFLAMLGHELRNPLAAISGAVHLLGKPPSPALAASATEIAERQVQHLARLVDDLLDVARITRGKIRLERRSVPLAAVVARAADAVRPQVEAQRHDLVIRLPDEPIHLDADPARLEQVFVNLLTNAAKYTEPGGTIRVTAARDGGEAAVHVEDTGIGIAPEMLPRLFEMFSQVDQSLDRAQGGLGIGLALARRLIEMHGGSITAESTGLGRGSRFTVRLPALEEAPAGGAEQRPEGTAAGPRPRRVLLVEDNRDAARMLRAILEASGHAVAVVHDGTAALEAARAFDPDVVLADIGLPGMSGYDVARQFRAEPEFQGVTLVALTGYGQAQDRERTAAAGFDQHLVKPVDTTLLNELLEA